MRGVSFALAAALVSIPGQTRPQVAFSIDAVEFPPMDSTALNTLQAGLDAKRMAQISLDSPADPRLASYFADHDRMDDAMRVLREIAERHPDRIARAFKGFPRLSLRGDARAQTTALTELIAVGRSHLNALPREEAAVAARTLLNVETAMDRTDRDARLRRFIDEYAGTDAALEAQVSLLSSGYNIPARVPALDDFASHHPGTCAGAAALYQKGFDRANNGSAFGERSGSDPTARFEQTVAVLRELERSGAYPASCEAVANAPQLVIGFYAYQPRFTSPDHVKTLIEGYKEFVFSHWSRATSRPETSSLQYVLFTKLGDLFAIDGDRIAGVEGVLKELEARVPDRDAVRYLIGDFYQSASRSAVNPHDELLEKAINTFRALSADGSPAYARRSLATVASLYFFERDYAHARDVYEDYLKRYPTTDWSWLARIRLGQTDTALGDFDAAVRTYDTVMAPEAPVLWRVAADAYASDVSSASGRADDALRRTERALASWDLDFGPTYRLQASQKPLSGTEPFAIPSDMTIAKDQLERRAADLRPIVSLPGAGALEQGRWLLSHKRTDAAKIQLERAITDGRGTAVETLARAAGHRASLDRALALADVANPKADEAASLIALDQLAAELPDASVLAAQIVSATIRSKRDMSTADGLMTTALQRLVKLGVVGATPAPGSLEADLVAIRAEVFRPLGGGIYSEKSWNAFSWPAQLPRFLVARAELDVQLAGETLRRVTLRQPIAGLPNVILLTNDDLAMFAAVMKALGGTARRATTQVMETPNQPIGPALDVRAFWNGYFSMRQGHWSGWVFETYPIINRIEFQNRERTKAFVYVEIGYSGGTVVMVKDGNSWKATELINLWIT